MEKLEEIPIRKAKIPIIPLCRFTNEYLELLNYSISRQLGGQLGG